MRKYVHEGRYLFTISSRPVTSTAMLSALSFTTISQSAMHRINSDPDVDSLRVELRKKDHDLLLAARFGKSLLEENDQLKNQLKLLRDEYSNLQESLESQKHEHQRGLAVVRDTAEMHISELEQQLKDTSWALDHEKSVALTSKEEHRKRVEGLQIENAQLQAELERALLEKQEEVEAQLELKRRAEECDREKREISRNVLEMQKEIQDLQDSNRSMSQDISTLAHACDKLSDELQASQEDVNFWEKQCVSKSGELLSQSKELEDSQVLVKQLQLQLDEQSVILLTPNSATSLFEELTSSNFTMIPEEVCSNFSDVSSSQDSLDLPELPGDTATLKQRHTLVREETSPYVGWPRTEEYNCMRCRESKEQLHRQEEELKCVTEQLLIAVQQKFKLQQQIEAWQTDMTLVVEHQIQKQLKRDHPGAINRKNSTHKNSNSDICTPTHEFMLHLLRNSAPI